MEDEQVRTKYLCGNILWMFTRKPQQYLRLISSNKCKGTSHDVPLTNDTTLEWVMAWGKIRFLIKMSFPYILVDSHFKTHGFHFQRHYLHLNRLLMIKLGSQSIEVIVNILNLYFVLYLHLCHERIQSYDPFHGQQSHKDQWYCYKTTAKQTKRQCLV